MQAGHGLKATRRIAAAVLAAAGIAACGGAGGDDQRTGPEPSASVSESPLGEVRELAFTRYAGTKQGRFSDIWVTNADGSGQGRLTESLEAADTDPTWAPNGERIAFTRQEGRRSAIWVLNADGTGEAKLLDGAPFKVSDPAWSPDGERIAFTGIAGSDADIHVMSADGGNLTNLTDSPEAHEGGPEWSPDGKRIAFVGVPRRKTNPEAENGDIYVMNADGSGATNLTGGPKLNGIIPGGLSYAPDGQRIAFLGQRTGDRDPMVWVMNADGSDAGALPGAWASPSSSPTFSPDGERIAFVGRDESRIHFTNVDGTEPARLPGSRHGDQNPVWSPGSAGSP